MNQTTPAEHLLSYLAPEAAALIVPLVVHPVVLDSSAIVSDITHGLRTETRTTLQRAMSLGVVRPYASHHVFAEVLRTLEDDSTALRVDRSAAEGAYWTAFAPYVRYIEVAPRSSAVSARLARRDASDVGTAHLVDLLGPVLSFSTDADLLDLDVATAKWVDPSGAAIEGAAWDALVAGVVVGARRLAKGWKDRAQDPHWRSTVGAFGVLLVLGVAAVATTKDGAARIARFARVVLAGGGQGMMILVVSRSSALSRTQVAACGDPSPALQAHLARALARLHAPCDAERLALLASAVGVSRVLVEETLAEESCFVRDTDGRWQLGKTMVAFAPSLAPSQSGGDPLCGNLYRIDG